MRIISLDVGEKRIGVARADTNTRIAVPLGFIEVNGVELEQIARILRINSTNLLVLGLPRSNEGNETKQSMYVRNFAKALAKKLPEVKIRFQDESLTSVLAEERLKKRRKSYQKGEIDAEAASIILQDFIENFNLENSKLTDNNAKPTKKETENMGKKSKKAKKKRKTLVFLVVLVILALAAVGGFLGYREYRAQEYARYLAEQEALLEDESFDFMIKPGETIFDIKSSLIDLGYSETDVEAAFNAKYDFDFLQNLPESATLEGFLYGETHNFYKNTPVTEILETFLSGMDEVIKENNLEQKYAERGLTLYEGITLASILQKEAKDEDQPTVAQVFYTRLENGMLLGSDVTASYAADMVDPDRQMYVDNTDVLNIDSCYNTRVYGGLPCGPISNPGLSALLAVANPTDTAYLYFLTGDDGLMYYSYTENEHIQNIYSHCQNLCNSSL